MKVLPKRASGCYWTHELKTPEPTPPTPKPGLRIEIDRRDRVTVVTLTGWLDTSIDEKLMDVFTGLVDEERTSVLLDMEGLGYLNSRGVSVFVAVFDQLRAKGGDLKLARTNRTCALVLERLGLTTVIQSFETVEKGIEAFEVPIEECLADGGLETFVAGSGAKVFHASRCKTAGRLREPKLFSSRKDARDAGLRPCKKCL